MPVCISLSTYSVKQQMNLNKEQLNDVRHAVAYYMYHHVSVNNPRYNDYEVILQLLNETKEEK